MTSPSSSVAIRMIPCMAGWAGPMPTWTFWGPLPVPLPSPSMNSRRVVSAIAPSLARRADQRLAAVDRIVLPQRMAHELFVHEKPARIRVILELHPEHVPRLALEPVGDGPEHDSARDAGVVLVHAHLQPEPMVVGDRVKMVDDLEARAVLAAGELQIVDGRQVHEDVEGQGRVVAAGRQHGEKR